MAEGVLLPLTSKKFHDNKLPQQVDTVNRSNDSSAYGLVNKQKENDRLSVDSPIVNQEVNL